VRDAEGRMLVALHGLVLGSVLRAVADQPAQHAAQWFFVREAWEPGPPTGKLDWTAQLRRYAGRAVAIVCGETEAGEAVRDLLMRVQDAAGISGQLRVQLVRGKPWRGIPVGNAVSGAVRWSAG